MARVTEGLPDPTSRRCVLCRATNELGQAQRDRDKAIDKVAHYKLLVLEVCSPCLVRRPLYSVARAGGSDFGTTGDVPCSRAVNAMFLTQLVDIHLCRRRSLVAGNRRVPVVALKAEVTLPGGPYRQAGRCYCLRPSYS